MESELNLSMFRAYDIRTPAEYLTPELAERLAHAEARYFREILQAPGVVVAHDARLTGPQYLTMAASVYQASGLDVYYLPGATSTSHFYFTAMQHPECAAVMFGASHNPAGDTGQKILGPGVVPIAEHIGPAGGLDCIRELYLAGASGASTHPGHFRAVDSLGDYLDYSLSLAGVAPGSLEGVPVFQDYLCGAGGKEMTLAFGRAGAMLTPLHYAADGRFPLGDPNPVKDVVAREGKGVLSQGDFLAGFFFDGDADRMDVYGSGARYLSSSFIYAAILPHIRARFPDEDAAVFADLKSNPLAVMQMARAGVTVKVIRNGHSQIKDSILADPEVFGAVEESAHFYEAFTLNGQGPFATENTLYLALLVTRAWKEHPERFEELFELQATTSREREWGHYFPSDGSRAKAMEEVLRHFEAEGALAKTEMDSGMDLEATMMRRGLPFDIDQSTRVADDWLQVCQRISQSENGLARWEVVAARPEDAREAAEAIRRIAKAHGGSAPHQG